MMSMIGKKIGEGGCAEVFEWGGKEQIVKVAKINTDIHAMRREFSNSLIAWENGLPAVRPYEMVEIDGRPAIVMGRIHGESLMERFIHSLMQPSLMESKHDVDYDILKITAKLLSETHRKSNLSLPSQREMMIHSIRSAGYLTATEKDQVIHHMERLPIKKQVCHGDPNPGNIMIRDGKAVFIDWMNASIGNPEADLAEYIIMIRKAILPPNVPSNAVAYFDSIREHLIKVFCEEYQSVSSITNDEIEEWILPVAARKLTADAISETEKQLLLAEIRSRL